MNGELEVRIKRLESLIRILMVLILFSLAGVIFLLVENNRLRTCGKLSELQVVASIEAKKIKAQSIEVIGSHGRNSMLLAVSDDGWVNLSFTDLDGKQRVALLQTPSGKPALHFFGQKSNRLSVGVIDPPNWSGEEFSIHLLDENHRMIWSPNVGNPY